MHLSDEGLAQYWAVSKTAGLLDLGGRGKVSVTGPDRISFLHAMLTNDIEKLAPLSGCHCAFLTTTGKLVATFCLYNLEDSALIDVDGSSLASLTQTLERFIIMDDVVLEDATPRWGHLSLQGPRSREIAAAALGRPVPDSPLMMTEVVRGRDRGWLLAKNWLAEAGCEVILPRPAIRALRHELLADQRVVAVGEEAGEVLRVEQGRPRFGIDMDGKNYPMEARLDDAISYTKGCYIGQEVVAKATYVGGVGRLLSRLRFSGPVVPSPGSGLLDDNGKAVGSITSAVYSPRLDRPIALGYLKRTVAVAGRQVQAELSDGSRVRGEVVERFLPI